MYENSLQLVHRFENIDIQHHQIPSYRESLYFTSSNAIIQGVTLFHIIKYHHIGSHSISHHQIPSYRESLYFTSSNTIIQGVTLFHIIKYLQIQVKNFDSMSLNSVSESNLNDNLSASDSTLLSKSFNTLDIAISNVN